MNNKKDIELYTIEKHLFKKLIDKGRKSEGENSRFITFRYMLPFRLPVEDKSTFELENTLFIVLQKEYDHYALQDGVGELPLYHSIIEATIKLKRHVYKSIDTNMEKSRMRNPGLDATFDKQLEILNRFIEVLTVKFDYLSVYNIDLGEVNGAPLYKVYQYKEDLIDEDYKDGLFILSQPSLIEADNYGFLTKKEFTDALEVFDDFKTNPYVEIALLIRKGKRAFHLYSYNQTIINYNTAFEVLLYKIVGNYYTLLNKKNKDKINNIMKNCGLRNLIDEHFYPLLKKHNFKDATLIESITNEYLKTGYEYRNKIVHNGMSYGIREATQAIESFSDLMYMIRHNMSQAPSDAFIDEFMEHNNVQRLNRYEEIKKYIVKIIKLTSIQ